MAWCAPRRLPAALRLGAVWCPFAPDPAWGMSSWPVSPCRHAQPHAARRWRPVTVRCGRGAPPLCALARGRPGWAGVGVMGPGPGGRCPSVILLVFASITPAARVAAVVTAAGGGGRAAQRAPGALRGRVGLAFSGAGGGDPGHWSVVGGQRVTGTPLPCAFVQLAPPAPAHLAVSLLGCPGPLWPPGSGVTPVSHMSFCPTGRGGGCPGSGGLGLLGGVPRAISPLPTPRVRRLGSEAPPAGRRATSFGFVSPAPSFVWGLGLRRRLVCGLVAPVAEGSANRPGQPDVGLRVRDAEHRPPFQERRLSRPLIGPSRSNHGLEDPLVVLPSQPTPRRYFLVFPVPSGEHGIEGPVPRSPSWSVRWPSSATHTPPLPGGGFRPPGCRGSRFSPGSNRFRPQQDAKPPTLPVRALLVAPAPSVLVPRRTPALPGRRPSVPASPAAPEPLRRGRAWRHCVAWGAAGGGTGGESGSSCRGQCCS